MKPIFWSRLVVALLCTGLLCGLSVQAAQQKPKPTEEEEETKPAKPAAKPDKKPTTEEEEEAPAKPRPAPAAAKPVDGPVNLAAEAKKAEHELIRKAFEEFAQPFDRVRTKSGKVWPKVEPLDVRFDPNSTTRAALKISEIGKGGEVALPRESVERVDHYEDMVVERVRELLQSGLDRPNQRGEVAVPRSVLQWRAQMLLLEALNFSTKKDVRKGDSWERVRREIRDQVRTLRIAQVRAYTDERSYRVAEDHARNLYNLKEPNQPAYAADSNFLDAVEYLYVTQAQRLLAQGQYLQTRQAIESMLRNFTNIKPTANVETIQKELQNRAQELVLSANTLAEQKQYSQALQMMVKAEDAWPALPGLRERRRELEGLYPTLRVGVRALPAQMSPTTAVSDADRMASKLIFESYLSLRSGPSARDGYAFKLGLDMPRSREGVWELVLPRDVAWSDGKPLTAADVKRSIEFLCDGRTPYYDPTVATYLSQVNGNHLDGVRVEDNQRLTLAFSKAHMDPFSVLVFDLIPNHKFDPGASPRNTAFGARPVGTGPFMYHATEGNEKIFVVNPRYRRPSAPRGALIREIRFVKYDDVEQAKQDVLSGKLQMLLDLPTTEAETLRGNSSVQVLTPTRPPDNTPTPYLTNPRVYFLAPNHRKPEFENADLRKGIAWAIDREGLLNKVFRSGDNRRFHQPLPSLFPVGSWAYDPENTMVPNPFRLELAKGFFETAKRQLGNLPTPTIKYPAEDLDAAAACAGIQTMLDAAGLKVNLQPVPRTQLNAELLKENPDFDLVYWHYDYDNETMSLWPLFDPHSTIGRNFMGYMRDSDLHGFLERLKAHRDLDYLDKEVYRLNDYLHKQMVVTPLWQLDRHVIVHRTLKPTRLHPLWVFQDVEQWELSAK